MDAGFINKVDDLQYNRAKTDKCNPSKKKYLSIIAFQYQKSLKQEFDQYRKKNKPHMTTNASSQDPWHPSEDHTWDEAHDYNIKNKNI